MHFKLQDFKIFKFSNLVHEWYAWLEHIQSLQRDWKHVNNRFIHVKYIQSHVYSLPNIWILRKIMIPCTLLDLYLHMYMKLWIFFLQYWMYTCMHVCYSCKLIVKLNSLCLQNIFTSIYSLYAWRQFNIIFHCCFSFIFLKLCNYLQVCSFTVIKSWKVGMGVRSNIPTLYDRRTTHLQLPWPANPLFLSPVTTPSLLKESCITILNTNTI